MKNISKNNHLQFAGGATRWLTLVLFMFIAFSQVEAQTIEREKHIFIHDATNDQLPTDGKSLLTAYADINIGRNLPAAEWGYVNIGIGGGLHAPYSYIEDGLGHNFFIQPSGGKVGINTYNRNNRDVPLEADLQIGNGTNPDLWSMIWGRDASTRSLREVHGVFGPTNSVFYGSQTNHRVDFRVYNRNKMTLSTAGYLGIGTETPTSTLTVSAQIPRLELNDTDDNSSWYFHANSPEQGLQIEELTPDNLKTDRLVIKNGGNVGIGTKTPGERLEVMGGLKIGNASGSAPGTIRFWHNTFSGYNGTAWVDFGGGSGGSSPWSVSGNTVSYGGNAELTSGDRAFIGAAWRSNQVGNSSIFGSLDAGFYTVLNGGLQFITGGNRESVIFAPSGNVGIGTTNPGERLEIDGALKIGDANGAVAGTIRYANNTFSGHNGTGWVNFGGGGSSVWHTTGANAWFSGGLVGIGTNAPAAPLHVKGNGGLRFEDSQGVVSTLNTTSNGSVLLAAEGNRILQLRTNGTGRLNVLGTGQVVIVGTSSTSPTISTTNLNKYDLVVHKGVLSEDFALAPVAQWADYVFDDDYELAQLSEVERFIEENNHLPDVPSTMEVKEEGYSLHDMNVKFLQKIEELTLYTIQQQKELDALKAELKALKSDQ